MEMKGNNRRDADIKPKQAFLFFVCLFVCSFYLESPRCVSCPHRSKVSNMPPFPVPSSGEVERVGRAGGGEKKDTQTLYIHRNSLMCCRCDGSLFIFFPLSVNDPCIVST